MTYSGELIKQLEEAVNRAMNASPEVHALVNEAKEQGIHVEPTLSIDAMLCESYSVEWLEQLYQLADRRNTTSCSRCGYMAWTPTCPNCGAVQDRRRA